MDCLFSFVRHDRNIVLKGTAPFFYLLFLLCLVVNYFDSLNKLPGSLTDSNSRQVLGTGIDTTYS